MIEMSNRIVDFLAEILVEVRFRCNLLNLRVHDSHRIDVDPYSNFVRDFALSFENFSR